MHIFEGFYSTLNAPVSPLCKINICDAAPQVIFCAMVNRLRNGYMKNLEWDVVAIQNNEKPETILDKVTTPYLTDTVACNYFKTSSGYYEFDAVDPGEFNYITEIVEGLTR